MSGDQPRWPPNGNIDWKYVDELLQAHSSARQVAAQLGCSTSILYTRCERDHGMSWGEYVNRMREYGKSNIRLRQYRAAMKGSEKMLLHLGKHWLDQHDKKEAESAPIPAVNVVYYGTPSHEKPQEISNQPQTLPEDRYCEF